MVMKRLLAHLLALFIAVMLAPAASADTVHSLGEAEIRVPADWTEAGHRPGREVGFTGPGGAVLTVRWWFPDEPLTGYADEVSSANRMFPAGSALVLRAQAGDTPRVTAAFERLNADGERLLLTVEGPGSTLEAVEALLLPIAGQVRFDADAPATAPAASLPEVLGAGQGGWHHDSAADVSVQVPAEWTVQGTDLPGGRILTVLAPDSDALFMAAVPDGQVPEFIDAQVDRFLGEIAIAQDIIAEGDEEVAGISGHAAMLHASIDPPGDVTLSFAEGSAWIFTGTSARGEVLLAALHARDAGAAMTDALAGIAQSLTYGPPPDEAATPATPPDAVGPDAIPAAPLTAEEILALASPRLGGDCLPLALDGDALTAALTGVAVSARAGCAGQGVDLVIAVLPQDARGAPGPLSMLYLRAFMAGQGSIVAFADPERRLLVVLRPDGAAGFAVEVADLSAAAPAPAGTATPAPAGPAPLFVGMPSPEWELHLARGGRAEWARYEGGAFVADVPAGSDFRVTGLRTVSPVVRLPAAGDGFVTRLSIDLETDRLDNVVIALVESGLQGQLDWHDHEIWLGVERYGDAVPELVLAVQQQVARRMPLPDASVLAGLEIELRPDGLIRVANGDGAVLMEGRLADRPGAGPWHLQISATAPEAGVAARLALRGVRLEELAFDPAAGPEALLGEAPQEVVLFDGRGPGPHFALHGPRDADLAALAGFGDGMTIRAEASGLRGLGLHSPPPVVWLDRFGPGGSARLRLEFDPAATEGVQVALAAPMSHDDQDPGFPRVLLHWRRVGEAHYLTRTIDHAEPRHSAIPAMPAVVELLLTPEGVQILAEGFPEDVLPWPSLQQGAGLRLSVLAMGDHDSQPAAMTLRRIALLRTPAPADPLEPVPAPGVEPLPVLHLFPDPAAPWEGYGLAGLSFDGAGRLAGDGSAVIEAPEGYEGGRVGLLSVGPVAVLDHRLDRAGYRLAFAFDPPATDGAEILLSQTRAPDMADGAEISIRLVRQAQGRMAGDWLFQVQGGFYATWTRRIPAAAMEGWDGRLEIRIAKGAAQVSLPGITGISVRDFIGLRSGVSLFAAVQSRSSEPYGAARMALRSVDGGWVAPPGMTARTRLLLLGTENFDAETWIGLLRAELEEMVP